MSGRYRSRSAYTTTELSAAARSIRPPSASRAGRRMPLDPELRGQRQRLPAV